MQSNSRKIVLGCVAVLMLAASPAAAKKKKAPPPPPPAPAPAPVVVIPARPYPPLGASPNLVLPAVMADGHYDNVNRGTTPSQTTWNLRSAYNVAALNCLRPEHAAILPGYKAFLKKHAVALRQANLGVDAEFRKRHGAAFIRPREAYMTKVYNYYAFPPTLANFCDAALAMSVEAGPLTSKQLGTFAGTAVPKLDEVFDSFYRDYGKYRADAAAWDAKYAPRPAVPQVVAAASTAAAPVAAAASVPVTR